MAKRVSAKAVGELLVQLGKVKRLKEEIAQKRDELRDVVEEINEIIESIDCADHHLTAGARDFDDAIQSLSQLL